MNTSGLQTINTTSWRFNKFVFGRILLENKRINSQIIDSDEIVEAIALVQKLSGRRVKHYFVVIDWESGVTGLVLELGAETINE